MSKTSKYSRIISLVLLIAIITFTFDVSVADASYTAQTVVNGSIAATILNVSVPTSVAFSVDPNSKTASYVAGNSVIQNNTNAPIKVLINPGMNFRQDITSSWKPTDRMPADKNWAELGKTESENNLAIGVRVADASRWRKVTRSSTLWVLEQNNLTSVVEFGEIDSKSSAAFTLEVLHGYAFSEPKTCTYNIVWAFTLAD